MSLNIAGKSVGGTGCGLMSLTWGTKLPSDEEAFAVMKAALEKGANFWNGGQFYGPQDRNSLVLLSRYFAKYPEDANKVVISIKGGMNEEGHFPDGSEAGIQRSLDKCLRQLNGRVKLGVFEMARVDQKTPIEDTMSYLAKYIKAGQLGGVSLSECKAETIRRAAKVQKLECVEVEFNLFNTDIIDNGVAATCAELNIPIVAYRPLGSGFLTGSFKSFADVPEERKRFPQFYPGNFEKNMEIAQRVFQFAEKKGCSPAQVAIAWIKAHSGKPGFPTILPIPGAEIPDHVRENATDISITEEEVKELDDMVKGFGGVSGRRYPDGIDEMSWG